MTSAVPAPVHFHPLTFRRRLQGTMVGDCEARRPRQRAAYIRPQQALWTPASAVAPSAAHSHWLTVQRGWTFRLTTKPSMIMPCEAASACRFEYRQAAPWPAGGRVPTRRRKSVRSLDVTKAAPL